VAVKIRELSLKVFMALKASGQEFVLVDVLPAENYEKEHIEGAISLPVDAVKEKAVSLLPKDGRIVVYCASASCLASTQAAQALIELGFTDVLDFKGGLREYKESNLPLAGNSI